MKFNVQIPSILQLPNLIDYWFFKTYKPDVSGWLQYPNHSLYLISPTGEVWNIKRQRLLTTPVFGKYKIVGLFNDQGIRKTHHIHRLVGELYVINPNPAKFDQVNHLDLNKLNNNRTNLEWTDEQGNKDHAIKMGAITYFGERHFNTKLKQLDIDEIRLSKKSSSDLSKQFKINPSTVRRIINNKTWKKI